MALVKKNEYDAVPNEVVIACFEEAAARNGGKYVLPVTPLSHEPEFDAMGEPTGIINRTDIYEVRSPFQTDPAGIVCARVAGTGYVEHYSEYGQLEYRKENPYNAWIPAPTLMLAYRRMTDEQKGKLLAYGKDLGIWPPRPDGKAVGKEDKAVRKVDRKTGLGF